MYVCLKTTIQVINTEANSEPSQISKMELFTKIINGSQLLDIFANSSIVDA